MASGRIALVLMCWIYYCKLSQHVYTSSHPHPHGSCKNKYASWCGMTSLLCDRTKAVLISPSNSYTYCACRMMSVSRGSKIQVCAPTAGPQNLPKPASQPSLFGMFPASRLSYLGRPSTPWKRLVSFPDNPFPTGCARSSGFRIQTSETLPRNWEGCTLKYRRWTTKYTGRICISALCV